MKRTAKTIMAFLTAMTMTVGAMGTAAYAEAKTDSTAIESTARDEKLAGKTFALKDSRYGTVFTIEFGEDGKYRYFESELSSYMGTGTWEVSDGTAVLTESDGSKVNRFKIDGDDIVFIADGSDNFRTVKTNDGDRFSLYTDEDASPKELPKSPTGLTYEIDDPDYMAEIDGLYGYMPLEDIVLKFWNGWFIDKFFSKEPIEQRWYYKHVYTDSADFEIDHHIADPRIDVDNSVNTAESLHITIEQGRADEIEARDGKVRKFVDVDIYWSILVADKEIPLDTINDFMKQAGLRSHVGQVTPTQFALHFDDKDFTTQDVLDAVSALYSKFGLLPGGVDHPYGTSELYYDSAYGGETSGKTYRNDSSYGKSTDTKKTIDSKDVPLEGQLCESVTYKFNPKLGILLIDGDGSVTWKDNREIVNKCSSYIEDTGVMVNYVIFGKNIKHDSKYDYEYADNYPGCNRWLFEYTDDRMPFRVCGYKGSDTDKAFNAIVDYFTQLGKPEAISNFHLLLIDDDTDAYDLVDGKEDIFKFDTVSKKPPYVVKPTEPAEPATEPVAVKIGAAADPSKATLRGDADVSGDVGISDVVAVAKFLLSSSSYPLKNDTAKANADMNRDSVINGLDTSALIENQLGK